MKNLLIALAVVFSATQAHATRIMSSVLEYREIPALKTGEQANLQTKSLTVYVNGKVEAYKGAKLVSLFYLSTGEVTEVQELIEEAREGRFVKQPSHIACFTTSLVNLNYTAADHTLPLYTGHECNGNVRVNDTDAGKELVTLTNKLIRRSFSLDR